MVSRISPVITATLALSIAFLVCFYNLNEFSISHLSDEVIHIRVTNEMWHSGNYFLPTHGDRPYLNKPPLKMWLTLPFLAVLGESNFSYRLPDALFGFATFALVYLLGVSFFKSHIAGLFAVLALAGCSPYVLGDHGIRRATQDSALVFFSTLFTFATWHRTQSPRSIWIVLGALAFAGGLLVKSVAGLLVPFAVCIFVILSPERRSTLLRPLVIMLVGGAGVAALYFIPLALTTPQFFNIALKREVFARVTEGMHNSGNIWYYFSHLFNRSTIAHPFVLTVACLALVIRLIRQHRSHDVLLVCWLVAPLVVITIAQSRLIWYLAPSFPAIALIIGGTLASASMSLLYIVSTSNNSLRSGILGNAVNGIVSCCIVVGVVFFVVTADARNLSKIIVPDRARLTLDRFVEVINRRHRQGMSSPISVVLVDRAISTRANPRRGKFNVEGLYLRFLGKKLERATHLDPHSTDALLNRLVLVRKIDVPNTSAWKNVPIVTELSLFGARKEVVVLLSLLANAEETAQFRAEFVSE